MSYTTIHIVAGGTLQEGLLGEMQKGDYVIGVDRGAYWLLTHGVVPDMAIGDFDSCSVVELGSIKKQVSDVRIFDPEKDFTDTELALVAAFKENPQRIVIYGAIGSRMDHTLSVVSLLDLCRARGIDAVIKDEKNTIQLVGRGRTILKKREGYYVSLIPVTDTICVTLQGLKYEISEVTISRGQTLGLSNEFAAETAVVELVGGKHCADKALIIQSRD